MLSPIVQVTVSVVGDVTEKKWEGVFESRTTVSLAETLQEDALRRQFLGPDPNNASEIAAMTAGSAAYLSVRLAKSPGWWASQGLAMQDSNVLPEVYKAVVNAINAEFARHKEAAEKARKDLAKDQDLTKE